MKSSIITLTYITVIALICAYLHSNGLLGTNALDNVSNNKRALEVKYGVEDLVKAIYWAEGGRKASRPFGIMTTNCNWENYNVCKSICERTIRNNLKRYKAGKLSLNGIQPRDHSDFLTFLHHVYANPDLHSLNKHWRRNVEYYLNNPKEIK